MSFSKGSEIQSFETNALFGASYGRELSPLPRPACKTNGSIVSVVCKYHRSWEVRIAHTLSGCLKDLDEIHTEDFQDKESVMVRLVYSLAVFWWYSKNTKH